MTDMRIKTINIEHEGRTYDLRCNFAVLAAVDFDFGGVSAALKRGGVGCALIFAEAMLNECSARHGWAETYDRAQTVDFLDGSNMSCGKLVSEINTHVLASLAYEEPTNAAHEASEKN